MIEQFSGRERWEIEERESATEMGKGKKGVGRDGEIEETESATERERWNGLEEMQRWREGEIEERWDEGMKNRRKQDIPGVWR